jgi:hypothetical protein
MKIAKPKQAIFVFIIVLILLLAILLNCTTDAGCRSGNIAITAFSLSKSNAVSSNSSLPADFKFTIQDLLTTVCGNWVDTTGTVKMDVKELAGSSLSYTLASEGSKCGPTETATLFTCAIGGQSLKGEFSTGTDLNGSKLFVVDSTQSIVLDLTYFKNISKGRHEFQVVRGFSDLKISVGLLLTKPF